MSIVTEVAYIPLQADLAIEDSTNDAGIAFSSMLGLLKGAKGCQRVYWSCQVEHTEVLEILIDWDNYDAFEAFPKTPEFQDFLALLPKIAAGAPTIKNARFRTEAGIRDIATAPVIEITTTFVPLDVDEAAYERIIDTFVPLFAQNTPGFLGSASGWVIEEQENPKDATGPKVKAFVVCFAWENIGAHLAAKQIPANSEAIQPWKKAILSAEMHHIKLRG